MVSQFVNLLLKNKFVTVILDVWIRCRIVSALALLVAVAGLSVGSANAQPAFSPPSVRDTVHINNCGSCHLPYAPGLLPLQSWQEIMSGLDKHFGNTVEVSADSLSHILAYLGKYALVEGQDTVMGQLMKDMPDTPPLRITELPTFVILHEIVAQRLEVENLETGYLSPCANCHRAAASHIFDKSLLSTGHSGGLLSDYK